MNHPIDGGGRGHRVFEDAVPLREHQIAGDGHGPALVALRKERKEHLHLVAVLLYVAEVIENEQVEEVEFAKRFFQSQVALRREQSLNKQVGADEENAMPA